MKHLVQIFVVALMMVVCVSVQAQEARTDADAIVTAGGGLMHCTVQSIDADGGVQVTGPWLKGEARIDMTGLRQIMLGSPAGSLAFHRVYITNGDIVEGNVVAVTAKHVKIGSGPLGALDIPRSVVERIDRRVGERVLFETDFARDGFGPWKPLTGGWKIENGQLVCGKVDGERGGGLMVAPLEHKGSVTFEYKMHSRGGTPGLHYLVMLYADGVTKKGRTVESLGVTLHGYALEVNRRSADKEKSNTGHTRHEGVLDDGSNAGYSGGRQFPPITFTARVACDLEKKRIVVWINGKKIVEERMFDMPDSGKFIFLGDGRRSCRMMHIRVMQGVLPPPAQHEPAEKESYVFGMKDGTRGVSPRFILQDGQITAGRADEQYAIALSDVNEIVMPKDGRTQPRSLKGEVWVTTQRGRVSLRITALTGEHLTGSSDYLGEMRIPRTALKGIVAKPVVIPESKTP